MYTIEQIKHWLEEYGTDQYGDAIVTLLTDRKCGIEWVTEQHALQKYLSGEDMRLEVGRSSDEFQIGHFLSALNELVVYFQHNRGVFDETLSDALKLYAKHELDD